MDLQKKQLDDLNAWLNKMEEGIAGEADIGASLEDVKGQIENHKVIWTLNIFVGVLLVSEV